MRLLLFDRHASGHHAVYVRRIATALSPHVDLIVAGPPALADGLGLRSVAIGPATTTAFGRRGSTARRLMGLVDMWRELRLLEEAERSQSPDVCVHLFADQLLPLLVMRPPRHVPRVLLVFRARSHYRPPFSPALPGRDRFLALVHDCLVQVWRRRQDACAVFTLDEVAAQIWRAQPGAPSYWFPEPPVLATPGVAEMSARSKVVLYGVLSERKGLGRLCEAVTAQTHRVPLILAGSVEAGTRSYVDAQVAIMRRRGISVDLVARQHTEHETLELLSSARCVVLPYVGHIGMSRVLLEACSVGTPVVAHTSGLIGHLVRKHNLGLVADADDAPALGAALTRMSTDDGLWQRSSSAARAFASAYASDRFADALGQALSDRPQTHRAPQAP